MPSRLTATSNDFIGCDLARILSNCSAGKFDLRIGRRPRVHKNEVDLVLLVCEDEGNPNPPTPLISETKIYMELTKIFTTGQNVWLSLRSSLTCMTKCYLFL